MDLYKVRCMNPKVRQAIADLLDLSASKGGYKWLAVFMDKSSEPVIHPPENRREIEPTLQATKHLIDSTFEKPVNVDLRTIPAESNAESSLKTITRCRCLKAVSLFDRTGDHLGLLVALHDSSTEPEGQRSQALARIARLVENQLAANLFENRNQDELEHSFSINRAILDTLYDAVVMTDMEGRIQSVNPALERMFGYPEKDLIGTPITKLMPRDIARHHPGYMKAYAAGRTSRKIMGNLRAVQGQRSDGTRFPLQIAITETTVKSQRLLVAALHDITESEAARIDLQRFRRTLDSTLDCVFMFDAETLRFSYVNQGAIDQLGYSEQELLEMHPYDVKPFYPEKPFREMVAPLVNQDTPRINFQTVHRHKDGRNVPVDVSLQYVTLEGDPPRFIAIVRDISEQERHREEIEHLAYFDPLTNLPNRSLIRTKLENAIQSCAASDCFGALMLTDLDDFKAINDTLGHREGDELLIEVSGRFAEIIGEHDSISRLGGDEFLIVINTHHRKRSDAVAEVTQIANRLLQAATQPTETLGNARPVSTSIGFVMFNDASTSASELMRMADIAMYDAKTQGKNHFSLFDEIMQQQMLEEHHLTADLNRALGRNDEIVPWFQPKVDQTGQFTGFEALVRWHHPEQGLLNPGSFIELAEKKNLIIPLGDQMLFKACQQMSEWRRRFPVESWTVSVNISQSQLAMADFPEKVEKTLTDTGLPARMLLLEVTESVVAENIENSIRQMGQLRALGVRFSMDDFGTGYSSLSYIRQLPIDELKIDRSFVDTILHDDESRSIVRVILLLADSLKLTVIAEGIETEEQWQALKKLGCKNFQGFLFSRPRPPEEILEALEQQGSHLPFTS
jgi:diguanylate cyclase (GGDEF)-like protein/PAS domain S-box-containing protein